MLTFLVFSIRIDQQEKSQHSQVYTIYVVFPTSQGSEAFFQIGVNHTGKEKIWGFNIHIDLNYYLKYIIFPNTKYLSNENLL